jgi:hypothetical protein
MSMILSLIQNGIQILYTSHDSNCHFTTVKWCFWAWIKGPSKPLTNLFNSCFKLFSLEEDDENGFVDLFSLLKLVYIIVFLIRLFKNNNEYLHWMGHIMGHQSLLVVDKHCLCKLSTTSFQTLEYVPSKLLQRQN